MQVVQTQCITCRISLPVLELIARESRIRKKETIPTLAVYFIKSRKPTKGCSRYRDHNCMKGTDMWQMSC